MKTAILASSSFWTAKIIKTICSLCDVKLIGYIPEFPNNDNQTNEKLNIPIFAIDNINNIDLINKLKRSKIEYVFCIGIDDQLKDNISATGNLTFMNLSSDIGQDFSQILSNEKDSYNIFFETKSNVGINSIINKKICCVPTREIVTSTGSKINEAVTEMILEIIKTIDMNKTTTESDIQLSDKVTLAHKSGIYVLTNKDKNDWDDFVNASEQGCVFSSSLWLDTLNMPWKAYCFGNGKKDIKAAILLIFDDNNECIFPDFTPFFSVLISNIKKATQSGKDEAIIKYLTPIIEELNRKYGEIRITCHPTFIDLRPFLWSTFLEKSTYDFFIKYTYIINSKENENILFEKLDKKTRYSIKMGTKYNFTIVKNNNIEEFVELYLHTFERQGITVPETRLDIIKKIYENICLTGNGCLYVAKKEKRLLSACMFIWDKKCSYYLFGANSEEGRKSNVGHALLWEIIKIQLKKGLAVDFVGCNSPERARFKRSFNGTLTPYYLLQRENK